MSIRMMIRKCRHCGHKTMLYERCELPTKWNTQSRWSHD